MNRLIKKTGVIKMKSILMNYFELKSEGFKDEPVTFIITIFIQTMKIQKQT